MSDKTLNFASDFKQSTTDMETRKLFIRLGVWLEATHEEFVELAKNADLKTLLPILKNGRADITNCDTYVPASYLETYLLTYGEGIADNCDEDLDIDTYRHVEPCETADAESTDAETVDAGGEYTTYEMCPLCDNEVELPWEFRIHTCPKCGKPILPCSICPTEYSQCSKCPLEQLRNSLGELEYCGKTYPCREVADREGNLLTIATTDLLKALDPTEGEKPLSAEAERVDNRVFYYAEDKVFYLPSEELTATLRAEHPNIF